MEKDNDKMEETSLIERLDFIDELDMPYKFPYEEYDIIGDTTEIDKVINTCGAINIDPWIIESALSKEKVNYVSTGYAIGRCCVIEAFKEAVSKLPVGLDCIADVIFNIWIKDRKSISGYAMLSMNDLKQILNILPIDTERFWGYAFDETLKREQVKVTLIAVSK